MEKIYVELYSLRKSLNATEIEIGSENESQLKRIRKPLLLLYQKEPLIEKLRKCLCLFDKIRKRTKKVFQKIFLIQNLRTFFKFWLLFLKVLKTKITSCQTLRRPSWFLLRKFCVTLSQQLRGLNISRFLEEI